MPELKYDAFISYRRSDGKRAARWLRHQLQAFRTPKALRHRGDRKLKVYLDTAYERATQDFYENNVRPALLASRHLIVVATRDMMRRPSGTTHWTEREIVDFLQGPNATNIVVVRANGELNDPLPADLIERFPLIEIVDLRGLGRFSFLNPWHAARLADEKLKVIGALLDVPPDEMPVLRREQELRQQLRYGVGAGALFATMASISALSVFALNSSFRADEALKSSLFSTERMINALANNLPRDETYGVRSVLLNQACDLMDKLSGESAREPSIEERVKCAIERALGREQQNEPDEAERGLRQALSLSQQAREKAQSMRSGLALVDARQELMQFLERRGNMAQTEQELNLLIADASRLLQAHPSAASFAVTTAAAYEKLAEIFDRRKEAAARQQALDHACDFAGKAVTTDVTDPERTYRLKTWHASLLFTAAEAKLTQGNVDGAVTKLREAVAVRIKAEPEERQPTIAANLVEIAALLGAIGELESARGNAQSAGEARAAGRKALARLDGDKVEPRLAARARQVRSALR